jgi:methyl-accepting chemotaxis protein
VQEIAAASQEQSQSVVQIGGAMGQLSKATQQNASASEELAATSEELSGQAEQLQHSVAFFTVSASSDLSSGAPVRGAQGVPTVDRRSPTSPMRGQSRSAADAGARAPRMTAPAMGATGTHGNFRPY